ncbi:MAG TPA: lasso RiPP family leader peptide-containing protein [Vicinamibacterales bacterium]|nr:lasso RiPP family leader peptide-containing protein [Vicinamibacterales bacterium]
MSEQDKKRTPGDGDPAGAPRRKRRYQKPELIEYGSVAKLTRGSKSVTSDAVGGGKKSKACL